MAPAVTVVEQSRSSGPAVLAHENLGRLHSLVRRV